MKEWKVLIHLEYEWRALCLYNTMINWLVKRRMELTSPALCFLTKRLDKHEVLVSKLKYLYEKQTGKIIVFYQRNNN